MAQGRVWRASVLAACCLLMCYSGIALGRDDPIEVLCLTSIESIAYKQQILRKEPMLDVTYVPTEQYYGHDYHPEYSSREVQKAVRMYFPRSYEDLAESYEFILLLTQGEMRISWDYFSAKQVEMMRRGIEEGGLGALRDQSTAIRSEVWGLDKSRTERWAGLSLSDAFPADVDALLAEDADWFRGGRGSIVINDDPSLPPVLKPYIDLPMWPGHSTLINGFLMIPRQGSQTYAWMDCDFFPEYAYPEPGWIPYVLGWRYGEGYTWSLATFLFGYFFFSGEVGEEWSHAGTYLYGHDAFFGLVMYGAGRDPPLDVVMVHEIRERFGEYADAKSCIESMIDFVERFEVNINPLLLKADGLQEKWEEGKRLHLAQEWEEARVIMDGLVEDMRLFTEEALAFKDRALLWVYVTEWATVTATFLISGFFLWSLMVSRRFYHKIDQTRLRPPPGETGAECVQYPRKESSGLSRHGGREHSRFAIS